MALVPPLRIGILTANVADLSPWELRLFDSICADARFELVAVLTGAFDEPAKAAQASWLCQRIFDFDAARFSQTIPVTALAFEKALAKSKVWLLAPTRATVAGTVSAETIAGIKDLALDVVLIHGFDDFGTALGPHIRFGAWSLRHAGQRLQTWAAEHALAFLDPGPLVRVDLVVEAGDSVSARILSTAAFNTERTPATTLARTADKAVSLIVRSLVRLAADRTLAFDHLLADPAPQPPPAPRNDAKRYALAMARTTADRIKNGVSRRSGWLQNRWSLHFGEAPFDPAQLSRTDECVPAKGEFWADPFLVEKNGDTFVFFENYVYAAGRGKISVGLFRNGQFHVLADALDCPYHLSFPLVFEHGGEMFMMPETCGAARVEIWRAVEFPFRWERHGVALEGLSVADPVLFNDGGRWWLFANISNTPFEDHCNELHVFEADGPALTRVKPHPLNPVVIGADTARNAGRIVRRDGRLLRLSQNNTHGVYGYGLNVMEITELSPSRYSESLITRIAPDFKPGLIGCHHMDQTDSLYVVDACRRFG